ncbi:MAG: thioesterase family protein [Eubacterium sp.]
MENISIGVKGEALTIVNTTNTAITAQSGSLPVFGTPFMIALMEKATCDAVAEYLEDGETTVGTKIDVAHSRASVIGATITAVAQLIECDGRRLVFSVSAKDENANTIGSGTIERFVVNAEKFMKKAEG